MNTHSGFTFQPGFAVRFMATLFAAAFSLVMSASAMADGSAAQVKTAAQHAGFAAQADNVKGVHTHLHHALNCLVGPNGDGFDSSEMNPCGKKGKGAIPDASDKDTIKSLEKAADMVSSGIKTGNYAAAKATATNVQKMLRAM
jgi:hypothetical protein